MRAAPWGWLWGKRTCVCQKDDSCIAVAVAPWIVPMGVDIGVEIDHSVLYPINPQAILRHVRNIARGRPIGQGALDFFAAVAPVRGFMPSFCLGRTCCRELTTCCARLGIRC